MVNYKPLTYNAVYTYPVWGEALGWALALSSMLCIPLTVVYKLVRCKGSLWEVSMRHSLVCLLLFGIGRNLSPRLPPSLFLPVILFALITY